MLRVKGPSGPPPPPEAMPPEAMPPEQAPPEAMPPEMPQQPMTFKKVDPSIAVYRQPDDGPFKCANCDHYEEEGSCTIVDGPIDPEGICSIFTPMSQDESGPGEGETSPEQAQTPPELPPQ